ncbi:unnamed protein product [Caenorhabditis bovis]|uniref:MTOR-associated protein MEAK7 n=1 Tax=Caenorhabditis bovis TaxID=2654633 RepID=A0A8S1F4K4_9PELO|nr:unnamed protein product [Caenorhabditis bovis]
MGAQNGKQVRNFENLSQSDARRVEETFKNHGAQKGKLDLHHFQRAFPSLGAFSELLFERISDEHDRIHCADLLQVCNDAYGSYDEQAQNLIKVFGDEFAQIARRVADFYCAAHHLASSESSKLAEHFEHTNRYPLDRLDKYLVAAPLFAKLSKCAFSRILAVDEPPRILPKLAGETRLMSKADLMVLNAQMMMDQQNRWQLLFASALMGSSFAQMVKRINREGPCIVVIQSKSDHVFGFYASDGFQSGPLYHGNETCFLFELDRHIRIFNSTGRVDKYAYLNFQQQSMPNGMGIGGAGDVWPLFIREDYGTGICQNGSVAFDACFVAKEKEFAIKNMEVWRIGEKPVIIGADGEVVKSEKSIIDKDPEARAILEMSGKKMHSEAYREPAPLLDDEDEFQK